MLKSSGRRVDISQPFVDALLPGGHRLHVVLEGITRGFSAVNIRKFVVKAAQLDDLVGARQPHRAGAPRFLHAVGACRAQHRRRRRHAGREDHDAQLPRRRDPRAASGWVSAEEVFELRLPAPRLGGDADPAAGARGHRRGRGCATWSRRPCGCGPSRIIVGEVRAEECLDLLLALNAGLPGMASLHANSAREALVKMCTLPLLAGENISARFVVPTVAASVDLVVHLGIGHDGARRVEEIVAVPGRAEGDDDRDRAAVRPRATGDWCAARACRRGRSASSGRHRRARRC